MAINETIVTGRKFRKLIDETTKQWQRFSFWTKASDVEFDDGKTLEAKIVSINGTADLLQEQVNNLNTDANGKINSLMTEINGLKETVEDLKTNPPSPPSPPEQNLPLALSGSVGFYAQNFDDEDDDLILTPWDNGTVAYLSSAGIVTGTIQLKYAKNDTRSPLISTSPYLADGSGDPLTALVLLSYPNKAYCPPINVADQFNSDRSAWKAHVLGVFKEDGTLKIQNNQFPVGYLWVGAYTGANIKEINYSNMDVFESGFHRVYFTVDFSQATFTQT